jgi:hypothetical protein
VPLRCLNGVDGGCYKPVKEVMNAVQFIQQGLPVIPNTIVFVTPLKQGFFPLHFIPLNYHGYPACPMACFTVLMEDFTINRFIKKQAKQRVHKKTTLSYIVEVMLN